MLGSLNKLLRPFFCPVNLSIKKPPSKAAFSLSGDSRLGQLTGDESLNHSNRAVGFRPGLVSEPVGHPLEYL